MQTIERLADRKQCLIVTCPYPSCEKENVFTTDRMPIRVCVHYSHMMRQEIEGETVWLYYFVKPGAKERARKIKKDSTMSFTALVESLESDVRFYQAELKRADARYEKMLQMNKARTRAAGKDTQRAEQGG